MAKGFSLDESEKLKRLPKGYAPGSPYDELLKLKEIGLVKRVPIEYVLNENLLENVLKDFRSTYPLVSQLNRAVQYAYEEMM